MAYPPVTNTERLAALALALLLCAAPAAAHDVKAPAIREMVRLQGYLGDATPAPGGSKLTMTVLGQRLAFTAAEVRIFAFAEVDQKSTLPPASELVGDRSLLRRFTTARPDQRLTILAERRPGSTDLFVLAVDRCPE
jgi:hypothetical protein